MLSLLNLASQGTRLSWDPSKPAPAEPSISHEASLSGT